MASGWYLVVARLHGHGATSTRAVVTKVPLAIVTMGCVGDGLDIVMGFSSLPNTTTCQIEEIDTMYGLQEVRLVVWPCSLWLSEEFGSVFPSPPIFSSNWISALFRSTIK
uniref:Uncharacterized protein n=1 Tax=Oryza meridionalis TaxID=40149 RepID=A0A0E0CHM7_9ORYZ